MVNTMVKSRVESRAESSGKKRCDVEKSVEKSVDASVEKVLDILKRNPYAPQRIIAKMLGLSARGVEEAMRRAKLIGRLKRSGGRKFCHWEVIG